MISVLISCLFNRLENIEKIIKAQTSDVEYIVIVQGASKEVLSTYKSDNVWTSRSDLKIIYDSNTGVTYSRNLAIDSANGDFALFTDDDVIIRDNFFELLSESFLKYPEYDFFTFNVEDENGNLLKPPLSKGEHDRRTILGVGTIQIAIRLCPETTKYKFPLDLGAGSKYPCCDEPVYLSIFMKNKKKGMHINKTICQHPRISSGSSLNSYVKIASRFIAFRYIFGKKIGFIIFIIFVLKKIIRH